MINKSLFLLAACCVIAFSAKAQRHQHAWFRATLSYPVSASVKTEIEFQHRRQNGFDSGNMFQKNLMYTLRPWVHYQHDEHIRFSVSPFAYFSHYRIVQSKADETSTPVSEIRFSTAMEFQKEIFKKFSILNRIALEYRTFNTTQSDLIRLRNRVGVRYSFTTSLKLSVYNEWLVNLSGTTVEHYFDHNRIGLLFEYQLSSLIKIELGYLHISRLPLTNTYLLKENNLMFNIGYQFRSKNTKKKFSF